MGAVWFVGKEGADGLDFELANLVTEAAQRLKPLFGQDG